MQHAVFLPVSLGWISRSEIAPGSEGQCICSFAGSCRPSHGRVLDDFAFPPRAIEGCSIFFDEGIAQYGLGKVKWTWI